VGSNRTITADVRLIAATNKNLEELVKSGGFREDLYFRLKVMEVVLPPLRERLEDIPLLAHAFLKEFASENGKQITSFTAEVLELLMKYHWPGNVRELRTAIEHAVVMCRGDKLTAKDLPGSVRNLAGEPGGDPQRLLARGDLTLQEAEKQLIIKALKETDGNRTLAAKKLGMSRRNLHRKLHQHQLEGH
jgi:DNA-binding NtrC family response regulator